MLGRQGYGKPRGRKNMTARYSGKRVMSGALLGAAALALSVSSNFNGALAQERPLFVNIGSTASSSGHYPYWVAVGQSVETGSAGQIISNVMETGSSLDNIRRLGRGEIEFGLVTAEAAAQAYLGRGVFEGEEPRKDLRTLWYYVATPNMFIVRADAGVETLSDLSGKPMNPGIPGSSTESIAQATFETLGIDVELVRGSTADAIAATRDGQVVGFVKSAAGIHTPDSSFVELNTFVDVRVIGLSEEQVELVTEAYPYFPPITVPPGVYDGQDDPYHTLAVVPGGVATVDSLSEEDAYEVVKHVFEQKALQDDAFGGVRDVNYAELTLEFSITPLHAGAVRYFREIGVEVPEHLVPEEAR